MFEKHIPLSNILAVTFTNKAAKEMKERLIHLSEEVGKDIPTIPPIRFSWGNNRIGTFHSIFLRILKEDIDQTNFWFTKNFGVYDSDEAASLIKKILKDGKLEKVVTPREAKWAISRLKNEGTTPEQYKKTVSSPQEKIISDTYEKYQTQLQIANAMDFDDLLLYPYRMFTTYPELLKKRQTQFSYILVDEAQDTNWIQFELMKQLTRISSLGLASWEKANITLIGDDFQSIYGRRGALMENFLTVKKVRVDIEIFKLQTNYRSKPHIVDAWSAVIKNNSKQYEKNIISFREWNDKIVIFNHSDDSSEALNLIDFIKGLKEQNKKTRSDFALLYRTNAQSSPFEQVLVQEWIPYKIFGGFRFFDRKEIKDIVAYMKYILNNRDNVAVKRIINIPSRAIGGTTIERIEQVAISQEVCMHDVLTAIDNVDNLNNPTKEKIKEFNKLIWYMSQQLTQNTPADFINLIVKHTSYRTHLFKEEGNQEAADERYANIGQLINMAYKYDELGEEELAKLMDEVSLLSDAAEASAEESDSIKLMTIHSSKWLEFPNVFIVGVEENIFPLGNARLEQKLLEEERRLMYVAITRAKDKLFISHANSRMQWWQTMYNSASRFIAEIPEELKKTYSLAENRSVSRPKYDEGDIIKHKLFGKGTIIEIWWDIGIIKFENSSFGVRKIPLKLVSSI